MRLAQPGPISTNSDTPVCGFVLQPLAKQQARQRCQLFIDNTLKIDIQGDVYEIAVNNISTCYQAKNAGSSLLHLRTKSPVSIRNIDATDLQFVCVERSPIAIITALQALGVTVHLLTNSFSAVTNGRQQTFHFTPGGVMQLLEVPYLAIDFSQLGAVVWERAYETIRTLDASFVAKDRQSRISLALVPTWCTTPIAQRAKAANVVVVSLSASLNWKVLLPMLADLGEDFEAEGGWQQLLPGDDEDAEEEEERVMRESKDSGYIPDDSDEAVMPQTQEKPRRSARLARFIDHKV